MAAVLLEAYSTKEIQGTSSHLSNKILRSKAPSINRSSVRTAMKGSSSSVRTEPGRQMLKQPGINSLMKPTSHLVDPHQGLVTLVAIQEGENVNEEASSFIQKRKLEWSKLK